MLPHRGAAAVLFGWRGSTIDVDIRLAPESDALLRSIQRLKVELQLNVEVASPADFIPVVPGWEERSPFAAREGRRTTTSSWSPRRWRSSSARMRKISMTSPRWSSESWSMPTTALEYFDLIEPELYRFPAIDPRAFRRRVENTFSAR